MKHRLIAFCLAILLTLGVSQVAFASDGGSYLVQPGDTMLSVATRHGVSVSNLAAANGLAWDAWLYSGQYLTIPGATPNYNVPAATTGGSYIVKAGDTLSSIASWHGTTVAALQSANSLSDANFVYVGQSLTIPSGSSAVAAPSQPAYSASGGERWIDVNLTNQTVTAYEGNTPVYTVLTSTGTWEYPTVVGTFNIYVKYESARMYGGYGEDAYDLSGVPYVMYFHEGYGIHGTYWHNNFGTPMSHGCVNLSTSDAGWFYNWASVGTKVVTHY